MKIFKTNLESKLKKGRVFFNFKMTSLLFVVLLFVSINTFSQVTFQSLSLPTSVANKNFYSISKQASNLYIAGDGCLLKSVNNGTTWTVMYTDDTKYFFDVKFTDAQTGYAVGWAKGANALNKIAILYKTVDGGNNWFLLYTSTRRASASTRFNEGEMRNGTIDFMDESRLIWGVGTVQFYSATGGRGNHCAITSVQTYSSSLANITKTFIGSSGILESNKGGIEYGISGYQSSDYYDLDLINSDDLYAITNGASGSELIKIKVNQTNTFTYNAITGSLSTDCFYGLDFLSNDLGYIVGKFGKVAYTLNAGSSWTQVTPFKNEQLNDVLFYSQSEAIVIGNNGTVLKMNTTYNSSVNFVDSKPSYNETVTNWSPVSSGTTNALYELEIKNGVGYIAGDGVILKSTNQGSSFTSIYSNSNYKFRDISFVDANIGWVIGYNISLNRVDVLKTSNGGTTWTIQTSLTGTSPGVITGLVIEAFTSSYVFASSIGSKKITTDGGLNWTSVLGNYGIAPIADFVFFGNNISSVGHQGYGPKLTGGGSYFARDLDIAEGGDNPGCLSLTCPNSIKNFGMNAISTVNNHLAIARDMDYSTISETTEGWIERSKIANPIKASDWTCSPTYTAAHFYGIKMISETNIWMVGEKGALITTKNAHGGIISQSSEPNPQKEWYGHNTGTHNNLYDIDKFSDSVFVAIGDSGTIIRTTNANSLALICSPILTSTAISNISSSAATSGGNISNDGGGTITSKGVCWSTSSNPTITNSKTNDGTGSGVFTSNLTSLIPNTLYYVRAYATNSVGTAYGNQVSFTTLSNIILPTLTTTAISNNSSSAATSGGNISSDGGGTITSKGVCWSTSSNPTITNSKTNDGTGSGVFTSNLTSLIPNTLYYVRAYATNSVGTAYGNQVSFTTWSTSINQKTKEDTYISLFPNPNNGKMFLKADFNKNDLIEINAMNILGDCYKIKYDFVENGLLELNIPENITGIITLEITINGKSTFEKVSIIK